MKSQVRLLVVASIAICFAQSVYAQEVPEQRIPPDQIPWPEAQGNQAGSAMSQGLRTTYLVGDGAKEGLYTMIFSLGPGVEIPPHSHPDARSCFVLQGNWYFGYGETFDADALQMLPPGSNYTEPAGHAHFAATRDTPILVECTSIGPTGTTFIDNANDPR
jgi:quercetin dioxygenase-like cupin family protein